MHSRDLWANAPTTMAMTRAMKKGARMEPGPSVLLLKSAGKITKASPTTIKNAGKAMPSEAPMV